MWLEVGFGETSGGNAVGEVGSTRPLVMQEGTYRLGEGPAVAAEVVNISWIRRVLLSQVIGGQRRRGGWAVSGGEVLDRVLVQHSGA